MLSITSEDFGLIAYRMVKPPSAISKEPTEKLARGDSKKAMA
jgi:hypothetical protein